MKTKNRQLTISGFQSLSINDEILFLHVPKQENIEGKIVFIAGWKITVQRSNKTFPFGNMLTTAISEMKNVKVKRFLDV